MHKVDVPAGFSIYKAIELCKSLAQQEYGTVEMVFNDVRLIVDEDSLDHDIAEIYRLKCKCKEYTSSYSMV